jgi:hypothetical protein
LIEALNQLPWINSHAAEPRFEILSACVTQQRNDIVIAIRRLRQSEERSNKSAYRHGSTATLGMNSGPPKRRSLKAEAHYKELSGAGFTAATRILLESQSRMFDSPADETLFSRASLAASF